MKSIIAQALESALSDLPEIRAVLQGIDVATTIERTRDASHGDFASNLAMRLAKPARRSPRDLAGEIVEHIGDNKLLDKVDIAGPGFINFHLSAKAYHGELVTILRQGDDYGCKPPKQSPRILLEFVSANPTGPLHVGHGRHAAFGATVGNLLETQGLPVHREYYVNDAGRQMDILGASVCLRWLEKQGQALPSFPDAGYKGEYILDIAANLRTTGIGKVTVEEMYAGVPADAPDGDKEAHIEALIANAKKAFGEDGFDRVRQQALDTIRDDIEDDLADFGVHYDRWFSEQSLTKTDRIDKALAVLQERGMLYEKDGATWFKATDFGDEKDRVVVRENGVKTYFASDIAYHFDKRERGFDYLIDILGSDHHGYVTRVKAGLTAMGYDGDDLEVKLVQFVVLYRNGEKVQMSTRSGKFDTLRDLRAEVGNDAARFFYVSRSNDQHLDFDLDVAKSESNDNPVYYIQYAHARIAQVFAKLRAEDETWEKAQGKDNLDLLVEPQERALMTALSRYPEMLETAATNRSPQTLVHYLRDLANDFHTYYNAHQFIVEDVALRDSRLYLCAATSIVLAAGLDILGVSAPNSM